MQLTEQVLAVLPDTPTEMITKLLALPTFTGMPDSAKVEKAISMILEGHPEASALPSSGLSQAPVAAEAHTPAPQKPSGKSIFAQARSNIFDDAIDASRVRRGKQDIENDTFLPAELKKAIMSAAARPDSDEEEDDEAAGRLMQSGAFLEDLGWEEGIGADRIRVKDNIDEESDAEDEADRQRSGSASRQATRPGTPAASGSGAGTGLPPGVEDRFIALYAKNPAAFSRDARKTSARADLRKETSCSDEQIEGWKVMFERNPRKDRILALATEFRGNVKGLEVRPGKPGGQPKTQKSGGQEGQTQAGEQTRGGQGGRGGSRGRGRGGQSEQKRRGNDRKLAKTGGVVG